MEFSYLLLYNFQNQLDLYFHKILSNCFPTKFLAKTTFVNENVY
jgi:hypothetical protein